MIVDYIKCKDVDFSREREEKFLDLSLVLRPFGSEKLLESVNESLENFLAPELLEGDCQYYCEAVDKKVDAVKGLKFKEFPYILTLQLKRFTFDMETFSRVKINEQFRFPFVIDLNRYMMGGGGGDNNGRDSGDERKGGDDDDDGPDAVKTDLERQLSSEIHRLMNQPPSDSLQQEEGTKQQTNNNKPSSSQNAGESTIESEINWRDMPMLPSLGDATGALCEEEQRIQDEINQVITYDEDEIEDLATLVEENGPHVYELYSILVHSGGAMGGHYYAYIKDLDSGEWHTFNDSSVSGNSIEGVKRAWGGGGNSHDSYGANAYMLMYRRYDPDMNGSFPKDEDVPSHIREMVLAQEEVAKQEEQERAAISNQITVKAFTSIKLQNEFNCPKSFNIPALKDGPYNDFLESMWRQLSLDGEIVDESELDHQEDSDDGPPTDKELKEQQQQTTSQDKSEKVVEKPEDADGQVEDVVEGEENEDDEKEKEVEEDVDSDLPKNRIVKRTSAVNLPISCFRLRKYAEHYSLPQEPFEKFEDKSLSKMGFFDYKSVFVEVRDEGAQWPVYSVNDMNLFIILYNHEKNVFSDKITVRVPKEGTLIDLKDLIRPLFDGMFEKSLEGSELTLMKLKNNGKFGCSSERFTGDESDRLRSDLRIFEAQHIHAEMIFPAPEEEEEEENSPEITTQSEDDDSSSSTKKPTDPLSMLVPIKKKKFNSGSIDLYVANLNVMMVKINKLGEDSCDYILESDRRWSSNQYRQEIAKFFEIDANTFRIYRNRKDGQELKDGNTPISQQGIYNNCKVWLVEGTPLAHGSHLVKVHYLLPPQFSGGGNQGFISGLTKGIRPFSDVLTEEELKLDDAQYLMVPDLEEVENEEEAERISKMSESDEKKEKEENSPENEVPPSKEDDSSETKGKEEEEEEVLLLDTSPNAIDSVYGIPQKLFGYIQVKTSPESDQFREGGTFIMSGDTKLGDIKMEIWETLVEKGYFPSEENFDVNRVRLREKVTARPANILRGDQDTLVKQSGFTLYDNREMFVEVLEEPEILRPKLDGDCLVSVQLWKKDTWSLGKRVDVLLGGNTSVKEASINLSSMFSIPEESIRFVLIQSHATLMLCDLDGSNPAGRSWYSPQSEVRSFRKMSWFLMDGDLMILQDNAVDPRNVTMVEKQSQINSKNRRQKDYSTSYDMSEFNFNDRFKKLSGGAGGTGYSSGMASGGRKESGMKIKKRSDRLAEEEAKKKQEQEKESEEEEEKKGDASTTGETKAETKDPSPSPSD